MTFTEGDLQIDFRGAVHGRRLDSPGHGLSHCMKAVDFVVELPDHYLFVELKDPQNPRATARARKEFVGKLSSGELDQDLKYKYRDSFLYEWASRRANKPIDYLVLIALSTLDEAHLLIRTEALARNLPKNGPGNRPWLRRIVRACAVFNVESWNRKLPQYPINRVSVQGKNAGTAP